MSRQSCSDNEKKAKGNILIVDDNPKNLRLLSAVLTQNGYKVRPAPGGQMALRSAHSTQPDLILLDIKMPDMDGYEVCRQLKADDRTKNVPIIFISALDDILDKVRAFDIGGVDYISKPFQFQEVLARVETHISLRDMQKKVEKQNIQLQEEIIERGRMSEALQKAHDELEVRVEKRTAALAKANRDLEAAKEAAEAASRAKTEFLANISHELRTPLSPIIAMTELVMTTTQVDPQQRELLDVVRSSAAELLDIINDLIELSRMESLCIEPAHEPFSLEPVLESVLNILYPKAEGKGLKLTSQTDPDVPNLLTGDSDILEQILIRLGANAVKFTEHGHIGISVTKEDAGTSLRFSVSDTGVGIPAEHLENLFRDFSQADGSASRKYGGIGLGLTMVRRQVNLIGGRIWAESVENKGSIFHIVLPFGLDV